MTKRSTDRVKLKIWHVTGTMEYDGNIEEGLFYGAHSLPPAERKRLIEKLTERHAELEAAGR